MWYNLKISFPKTSIHSHPVFIFLFLPEIPLLKSHVLNQTFCPSLNANIRGLCHLCTLQIIIFRSSLWVEHYRNGMTQEHGKRRERIKQYIQKKQLYYIVVFPRAGHMKQSKADKCDFLLVSSSTLFQLLHCCFLL